VRSAPTRHDREAVRNTSTTSRAYTQKGRSENPYTGQDEEPDERLMRSIEDKIDIPESRKDDFRRRDHETTSAARDRGRQFDYKTNERLHKALEGKLFEDQKDSNQVDVARLERRRIAIRRRRSTWSSSA